MVKKRILLLSALLVLFSVSEVLAAAVDFRDLVKAAGPAVVNINTERIVQKRSMLPPGFDMFRGHPDFERFFDGFDGFSGGSPRDRTQRRHSLGSGFVISPDGYIVTNNHVIEGADVINVSFSQKGGQGTDGYKAKVVGTDPDTDLALLKIEAENLPYLRFGNSDALEVGEWLVAIGNPLGLDKTVTAGILSAKGRNIHSGNYDDFLQTDASINPGNSGGPLLNMAGEVIGINTAIAQRAQGIGFAIPSTMAQKIIDDLKQNKKVSRGWLGVTIQNIDDATAKALGLPSKSGALIGNVIEGQPAEKAGIKSGDVILAINGVAIEDTDQLLRRVAMLSPGKEATVTIWRDGKKEDKILMIAERVTAADGQVIGSDAADSVLGLQLRVLDASELSKYRLRSSGGLLVVKVQPEGTGAAIGLRKGDVIVSVNKKPVTALKDLNDVVVEAEKKNTVILLHIARDGGLFFVAAELGGKPASKK